MNQEIMVSKKVKTKSKKSKSKKMDSPKQQKSPICAPVEKPKKRRSKKKKTTLQMICGSFVKQDPDKGFGSKSIKQWLRDDYGLAAVGKPFNLRFRKAIESGLGRAVLMRTESSLEMKGSKGRFRLLKPLKSMLKGIIPSMVEPGFEKENKKLLNSPKSLNTMLNGHYPMSYFSSDILESAAPKLTTPNTLKNVSGQNSYSSHLSSIHPKIDPEMFKKDVQTVKAKYGRKKTNKKKSKGEACVNVAEYIKDVQKETKSKGKKGNAKRKTSKMSKNEAFVVDSLGSQMNSKATNLQLELEDVLFSNTPKSKIGKSNANKSKTEAFVGDRYGSQIKPKAISLQLDLEDFLLSNAQKSSVGKLDTDKSEKKAFGFQLKPKTTSLRMDLGDAMFLKAPKSDMGKSNIDKMMKQDYLMDKFGFHMKPKSTNERLDLGDALFPKTPKSNVGMSNTDKLMEDDYLVDRFGFQIKPKTTSLQLGLGDLLSVKTPKLSVGKTPASNSKNPSKLKTLSAGKPKAKV